MECEATTLRTRRCGWLWALGTHFRAQFVVDRGPCTTATATATGVSLHCIPWYQLDTPIAATPTELHSLILRDTLVNARRGTNSTEVENHRGRTHSLCGVV